MDMIVNIALGRGSDDQRMMFLTQIAQKQEMIIEKYGPYNPMVSLEQYRATLAKIIQLSGFQDPSQFIKEVNPQEVQAFIQQQQQNAKKPDPAEILAQVEAEKIKADIVINAAKQELERQKVAGIDDPVMANTRGAFLRDNVLWGIFDIDGLVESATFMRVAV